MIASLAILASAAIASHSVGQRAVPQAARMPAGLKSDAARSRVGIAQYAQCLMERQPKKVERALAMPAGDESRSLLEQMAVSDCLRASKNQLMLSIPPAVLRGSLYAELVRRRISTSEPERENVDLTLDASPENQTSQQHVLAVRFGDCVRRSAPMDAYSFVVAPAESAKERQALTSLMPSIANCIDAGQKFTLSKSMLEGVIAEAIYLNGNPASAAGTN